MYVHNGAEMIRLGYVFTVAYM